MHNDDHSATHRTLKNRRWAGSGRVLLRVPPLVRRTETPSSIVYKPPSQLPLAGVDAKSSRFKMAPTCVVAEAGERPCRYTSYAIASWAFASKSSGADFTFGDGARCRMSSASTPPSPCRLHHSYSRNVAVFGICSLTNLTVGGERLPCALANRDLNLSWPSTPCEYSETMRRITLGISSSRRQHMPSHEVRAAAI